MALIGAGWVAGRRWSEPTLQQPVPFSHLAHGALGCAMWHPGAETGVEAGVPLLRAMLHAHPHLHAPSELKVLPELMAVRDRWRRTLAGPLADAGVDAHHLDLAFRALADALLEAITPEGLRLVEKTPHHVLHLEALAALYPRARFVHVVRDGRAVVASLLRQPWVRAGTGEPIAWCTEATTAARYWSDVVQLARQQAAELPGRVLEVRYERLVADPEAELRRVLAFLGEPFDAAVLRHETGGAHLPASESSSAAVAAPVHRAAVDRWRSELTPAQLKAVADEAGPLLESLEAR